MYIGIDLGTSGIKSIVMDDDGNIIDTVSRSLVVYRPQPLWSEQYPMDWWAALQEIFSELSCKQSLAHVKAIGLTGQMHGSVLLDENNDIIRPCILWNDGRSLTQCTQLESLVPTSRDITGNIMMPGFTAPKLLWLKEHESENFNRIAKVLLPKDYLRYCLTGRFASDMSDASGTMWLDVAKRDWNDELLNATGLSREHMPTLYEGNLITGYLHKELAECWGLPCVPIIAGGGDNAAGAVGVGIIKPGQAMLSLGTSGVYFVVSDGMVANPDLALHSYCHALPDTWHAMSVMLSAASCLDWLMNTLGYYDVATMLEVLEQSNVIQTELLFLPYLSGERTPHNNPKAKGVFFGLTMETKKEEWILSVLEGVAFAFADGADAVHSTQCIPDEISLIGGGARSHLWRQLLCNVIGLPMIYRKGGDVGPALGAARLAKLAMEPNMRIEKICPEPEAIESHSPDPSLFPYYQNKLKRYRSLYKQTQALL